MSKTPDTDKQDDPLVSDQAALAQATANEPKAEKQDEKFVVSRVIDFNNVELRTAENRLFIATIKDSTDLKAGDKVEVKAKGVTDGVPWGASIA